MVQFIEEPTAPWTEGLVIALLTFAANLIQCWATHAPMVESGNIGFKLRATMMHLVFRKSMVMSNAARQDASLGQIVNLMANDANRFCTRTQAIRRCGYGSRSPSNVPATGAAQG